MASITCMLPEHCLITRDGRSETLLAQEVVPGDILVIKAGNKLPADVRFVKISADAEFDGSILTGKDHNTMTQRTLLTAITR
jgi:sodium/potassium-transporting ATPase subunit alpha